MISTDMVAYDPETDLARIYSHAASAELRDALGAAVDEYGDGLLWMDAGWISASNHAPFDSAGYQAALLIEGSVWDNPYYHTSQDCFDTPGYLNFPYAVKMTRSIVGWLVDQAGVQVAPLFIRLPDGVPDRLDPDVATAILVQIDNGAETYVDGSAFLHHSYYGGPFETEPLIPLGGNLHEAILPPASCDATPLFYFSATGDEGSVIYNPEDAPFSLYSAVVATLTTYLADDFEDHLGWTVEDIDIETGTWERGVPAADGSRGDPTVDADGSGQCYVTDNRLGNYDVDGGPTRLISPTLDLSMTTNPIVRFAVWFNCDDDTPPSQDFMDIEASDDGGASWALVATLDNTDGWAAYTVPLANYITPTGQVQLRFSVADSPNNSVTEAGIDAFEVYELTCTPAASGDFDEDGDVDVIDCAHLQRCFSGSGAGYDVDGCGVFDFDGDDDVDSLDWTEFAELLVGPY